MANDQSHDPAHARGLRSDVAQRALEPGPQPGAELAGPDLSPLSSVESGWLGESVAGTLPPGRGMAASRESLLLRMQGAGSNQAVQRFLQRSVNKPAVIQRAPPGDAGAAPQTDNEGNEVSNDGGKDHLTKIPEGVGWHTGKPEALPPNPKAVFADLLARVQAVAAEQLANAESLKGDMKYWFAKVYHFVTVEELKAINSGTYQAPLMKMQEVIAFNATYKQNLDAWRDGNKDKVEGNWKAAFQAAEKSNVRTPGGWALQVVSLGTVATRSSDILDALLPAMEAHIRFDLPRAIAACYEANYAGIPGITLGDFQSDFNKMEPVFAAAQADLQPEIDQYNNAEFGVDPGNWHWMQSIGFPVMFTVSMEREQAWEKASAIVDGHAQGITDQSQMQSRLQAYMSGAHPFAADGAFTVGDQMVVDYDWNNQPLPPIGPPPPPPAP